MNSKYRTITRILIVCVGCSCNKPATSDVSRQTSEATVPGYASSKTKAEPCLLDQKLNTIAGELRINELEVAEPASLNHFYEINLNGNSINKEVSYCTMIDKKFGSAGQAEVVLISQRIQNGGNLADVNNNPIGTDTKYKLLSVMPNGKTTLTKSFGNGAPYVKANKDGDRVIIEFQEFYFLNDPNRYTLGYDEKWIYQAGKLKRIRNLRTNAQFSRI